MDVLGRSRGVLGYVLAHLGRFQEARSHTRAKGRSPTFCFALSQPTPRQKAGDLPFALGCLRGALKRPGAARNAPWKSLEGLSGRLGGILEASLGRFGAFGGRPGRHFGHKTNLWFCEMGAMYIDKRDSGINHSICQRSDVIFLKNSLCQSGCLKLLVRGPRDR